MANFDYFFRMTDNEPALPTAVLYNAECPVCAFEINHYASVSEKHDLALAFDDLNDREALSAWGLDKETAAKRLHVRKNGEIHSGMPAFVVLWRDMPRYRWLSRLVDLPVVRHIAVFTYDYVLAPLLYNWHLRRNRRKDSN